MPIRILNTCEIHHKLIGNLLGAQCLPGSGRYRGGGRSRHTQVHAAERKEED